MDYKTWPGYYLNDLTGGAHFFDMVITKSPVRVNKYPYFVRRVVDDNLDAI